MADEKINVPITTSYDDDAAKKAIKDAEKIEKLDPELTIDADGKAAEKEIKEVTSDAKALDKLKPEVDVTADTSAATKKIEAVSDDAKALTQQDTEVLIEAEIETAKKNIKEINEKLKELGATPIKLDTTGAEDGLRKTGDAANEARGRMSELVGESVAELPGIGEALGPAGEALSNITESALSGEAALGGLAAAAGGMALVTVGFKLISGYLEDIAATKAFNAKEVEDYVQAIRDGESAMQHLNTQIEEAGKIEFIDGGDVKDASDAVDDLGLKVSDFNRFVRDESALDEYSAQFDDLRTAAEKYASEQAQGIVHTKAEAEAQAEITEVLGDVEFMTKAVTQERQNQVDATAKAERIERLLGHATKETEREQRRLNTAMGDGSHAASVSADAYTEYAAGVQGALDEARTAVEEYDSAVGSADFGKAAVAGAVEGMSAFTAQQFALKDIAAQTETAFDDLGASLKENKFNFDLSSEAGRANTDALKGVATALDTQLAGAFTDAKGDMDVFKWNATVIANQTLDRLKREFGLTDDEVAILAESLGLLPEDIETRYTMTGNAVALEQLGLLQSAIDSLPKDVQTTVTQQILHGDYVGAVATVQKYADDHPVTIKVNPKFINPVGAFASPYNNDGTRNYDGNVATPGMVAPPAPVAAPMTTVNVNMAPGARGVDVMKQISGQTRRTGRRYGTPVVHYATRKFPPGQGHP